MRFKELIKGQSQMVNCKWSMVYCQCLVGKRSQMV